MRLFFICEIGHLFLRELVKVFFFRTGWDASLETFENNEERLSESELRTAYYEFHLSYIKLLIHRGQRNVRR
jgi:hypothetical protein